ncbi:helix-turn-helix domain-containing protein [Paenibacillus cymbidii]|uniref:helix-turn-helix domain-containing protein n=1 Tax=Paenibacillus cymbidii TaxID=1639034 RepID=UPI001081ABD0|nr:helix-turn-helix transcriptional regulator [Paenibacillus cymbidii]
MSQLGERIRQLRERKQMTQKELASESKLTIVQLSRYETNHRKPDPDALSKIADALETTTDYLLGRSSSPIQEGDTGRAYYGGSEQLTPEEIMVAEAAIDAYRKALKVQRNQ